MKRKINPQYILLSSVTDKDLFICSIGKVNYLQEMGQEVQVAGNLGEDSISGYLIWVNRGDGKQFLILSGNKNHDTLDKPQSIALEIAQQLINFPHMKAAA